MEEEKKQNEHWAELGGAIIEGGVAHAAGLAGGEGSHILSWIWYSAKAGAAADADDVCAVGGKLSGASRRVSGADPESKSGRSGQSGGSPDT
jgi:hypothetical protein